VLGLRPRFMAKHTLFRGPLGPLFRALGGIAIRRHLRENVTQQMVEAFRADPSLVLAVPAEGTRDYVTHWKSGFYHIARGAGVPLVPAAIAGTDRLLRLGPLRIAYGPPVDLAEFTGQDTKSAAEGATEVLMTRIEELHAGL